MKKDAIQEIASMAKNEMIEVDGRPYSTKSLNRIAPPTPSTLAVSTLQAVADYLSFGDIKPGDAIIHVVDFDTVNIVSNLDALHRQREKHLSAECKGDMFRFGSHHEIEQFIVMLQAQFIQDETTAAILKVVGNLVADNKLTVQDDGISQTATIKTGIVDEGREAIPNPVTLSPYRTFPEILQPASKFVFRMKGTTNPTCAFHEADGGAWKLEAIKRITEWLKENTTDINIIS